MVAGTDARVLITGESGTGKELLARAMHKASPRRSKPFVVINCSAHGRRPARHRTVRHATRHGTAQGTQGLFQTADGGTLLLDEIGDTADAPAA